MIQVFIGVDPGAKNCAFSIVRTRIHRDSLQFQVIKCGLIQNLIPTLVSEDLVSAGNGFTNELDSFLQYGNIERLVCERFQARGRIGTVSELTNITIGLMVAWGSKRGVKVRAVTAATWKNRVNTHCNLKLLYKQSRTTPHEVDATLIALYEAYLKYPHIKPYSELGSIKNRNRLLDKIEAASTSILKNRRTKRTA